MNLDCRIDMYAEDRESKSRSSQTIASKAYKAAQEERRSELARSIYEAEMSVVAMRLARRSRVYRRVIMACLFCVFCILV